MNLEYLTQPLKHREWKQYVFDCHEYLVDGKSQYAVSIRDDCINIYQTGKYDDKWQAVVAACTWLIENATRKGPANAHSPDHGHKEEP